MAELSTVLFIVYWIIVSIVSGYLAVRALQTRTYHVLLLACCFMSRALVDLASLSPYKALLRGVFDYNDVLLVMLFTLLAYHQNQKTKFPVLFSVATCLRVVAGLLVTFFDFDIPTTRALDGFELVMYRVYLACGAALLVIGYGWLVHSAWSALKKSEHSPSVPGWFKFRNKWIAIAFTLYLIGPLPWFLFPVDGSGVGSLSSGSPGAIISVTLIIAVYFAYVFNAMAWITPRFIITRFGGTAAPPTSTGRDILAKITTMGTGLDPAVSERILDKRGVMDLVNFMGDFLATLVDKPPNAVKGLLLISIQARFGEDGIYVMKLKQIMDVIHTSLRKNLLAMNVQGVDDVVKTLSDKMVNEQAVLLMMAL